MPSSSSYYKKYCTESDIEFIYTVTYQQVSGSEFNLASPATFYESYFDCSNPNITCGLDSLKNNGDLEWLFDELTVYDSVVVKVQLQGQIINSNRVQ